MRAKHSLSTLYVLLRAPLGLGVLLPGLDVLGDRSPDHLDHGHGVHITDRFELMCLVAQGSTTWHKDRNHAQLHAAQNSEKAYKRLFVLLNRYFMISTLKNMPDSVEKIVRSPRVGLLNRSRRMRCPDVDPEYRTETSRPWGSQRPCSFPKDSG